MNNNHVYAYITREAIWKCKNCPKKSKTPSSEQGPCPGAK